MTAALSPALIVALAFGVAWLFRDFRFDDAYIVAQYARNLAGGAGWTFNPGERHNGATSPLYTLLVAAAARLGAEPVAAGHWLSVAALALAACLLWRLLARGGYPTGGLAAGALLATSPLLHLTVGLESTLYLALLGLGLRLYVSGRLGWAGVALGALVLTRGDGAIVLAAVAAHAALTAEQAGRAGFVVVARRAVTILVPAGVVVAPWLGWSVAHFGSPFPGTLAAKLAHVRSGLWQEAGENLFLSWLAIWLRIFLGPPWPLYPFAAVGLARLARRRSPLLLGPAAVVVYLLAYAAMGIVTYHWYMAPVIWALALLGGVGTDVALRWLGARIAPSSVRLRASAPVAVLVVATAAALLHVPGLDVAIVREASDPRDAAYVEAGDRLRALAAPSQSFAAVEAGTIGYRSGLRAIDPIGLVSPGLAERLGRGDNWGWLTATAPDYVVLHEPPVLIEADLLLLPEFRARYAVAERFATPRYRYELAIYRRTPASSPAARPVDLTDWPDAAAVRDGWRPNAQLAPVEAAAGRFVATGGDPFLVGPPLDVPVAAVAGVDVTLRARTAAGRYAAVGEVYWARDEEGFGPDRCLAIPLRADGLLRRYRVALDLGDAPDSVLRRLRVDPLSEPGEVEIVSIRLVSRAEAAEWGPP